MERGHPPSGNAVGVPVGVDVDPADGHVLLTALLHVDVVFPQHHAPCTGPLHTVNTC